MEEVGEKVCRDCGESKSVTEFWRRKASADGLALYCKACFGKRNGGGYRRRQAEKGKPARPYRPLVSAPEGTKFCPRCEEVKARAEFGANRSTRDGATAYCKPCHSEVSRENRIKHHGSTRNYQLKRRYGITEDDFERMLAQQGGLCAICKAVPGTFVDHCHVSGQVRGVLCFNCNNGLGHFADGMAVLERAALYLEGEIVWPEFVVPPERRSDEAVARTRSYHLARRYRMRHEDVERMVTRQHGLCVVCWVRPPEHVDHCHRTGEVRYALCLPCNTGIGQFRDDPAVLWRALAYVESSLEVDEAPEASDEEVRALIAAEEEARSAFYERAVRV